jgi:hypothetical protein
MSLLTSVLRIFSAQNPPDPMQQHDWTPTGDCSHGSNQQSERTMAKMPLMLDPLHNDNTSLSATTPPVINSLQAPPETAPDSARSMSPMKDPALIVANAIMIVNTNQADVTTKGTPSKIANPPPTPAICNASIDLPAAGRQNDAKIRTNDNTTKETSEIPISTTTNPDEMVNMETADEASGEPWKNQQEKGKETSHPSNQTKIFPKMHDTNLRCHESNDPFHFCNSSWSQSQIQDCPIAQSQCTTPVKM